MSALKCDVCLTKKTALRCSLCDCLSCKKCMIFINENLFEFESLLPEHLRDKGFCPNCYENKASDELADFQSTFERAKNIDVYTTEQGAETGLWKRVAKPVRVENCAGEKETLMRLAFLAAQGGHDTLVDTLIKSKKTGKGTYKKLIWTGVGVPMTRVKRSE